MLVGFAYIFLQLVGKLHQLLGIFFQFLETLLIRLLLLIALELAVRLVLDRVLILGITVTSGLPLSLDELRGSRPTPAISQECN